MSAICTSRARWWAMLLMFAVSPLLPQAAPSLAQTTATNLIANPGFETNGSGWQRCGDATVIDALAPGVTPAMVHAGRYAMRIHYNTDDLSCGGEAFFDPVAQAGHAFTVPTDAQDLTISFWYSRIDDPWFELQPILGTSSDYAERAVSLSWVYEDELSGWNLYRTELTATELDAVRGRTINLFFSIFTTTAARSGDSPGAVANQAPGSYYIDDVRVVAGVERTAESPLPAALQSDGTRPIVYLSGALDGIARMNRDGSGGQMLYSGRAGSPLNPVWSSKGDRIAVLDNWLTPENNTNLQVIPAFITILSTVDANGGGLREIYRTAGLPGRRGTPTEEEIPALDVEIYSMDWSPGDDALALTLCSRNRDSTGATTDSICWAELISAATGDSIGKIEPAFRPNWGFNNRLLFEDTDAYQARPDGVWEVDLTQNPPVETLLVPGTGAQFAPSLRTDNWPVWSPDGTKFATVRDVAGLHYDDNGNTVFHDAIMLFERTQPVGEMLLLVDHGSEPTGLTWSPDGNYLLYNLTQGDATDIWWVEVASGLTGKVTNDGASIAANWRPACPTTPCNAQPTPTSTPPRTATPTATPGPGETPTTPSDSLYLPFVRR
jgi:hypothetical protein